MTRWPTLVVRWGMRRKRKLANSCSVVAHDVKRGGQGEVVVTMSINQKRRDITLEEWGCDAVAVEQKVTHSIQMQQEEGQVIDSSDCVPVVISFEKLFGRPAKDGEGDIVFGRDDLESFAAETWVVQFEGPSYF